MILTLAERLILANQYRILEKIEPDEPEHSYNREVVERGFTIYYLPMWLSDEEVPEEECKQVHEILDMYRALNAAVGRLGDDFPVETRNANFEGFDGNNETRHYAYAEYVVNRLGKWSELKAGAPSDLNSHSPVLDYYRGLVVRWRASADRHKLTVDDVRRIFSPDG